MSKSKQPLKIFLCHASQDKPIVRELHQRLKAEDWIDLWFDEKNLLLGDDWRSTIEEAVETSDIVIICLSSNSVSKEGFVQKEIRYAREMSLEKLEGAIFIIPLRINECDVPRGLRFFQYADYFGDKKSETYDNLLKSLRERHKQVLKLKKQDYPPKEDELKHKSTELHFPISSETNNIVQTKKTLHPTPEWIEVNKIVLSNGMEFMRIPAGKFLMGSNNGQTNEQPLHEVDIPYDYWMARFPVTNQQILNFYDGLPGKEELNAVQKFGKILMEGKKNHPNSFSRDFAETFCMLLSLYGDTSQLPSGAGFRIPTEAEWEKASRGLDGREYPWGNEFKSHRCHITSINYPKQIRENISFLNVAWLAGIQSETVPVGEYSPQGDSPFGCADMAGNVWEITNSQMKSYPYNAFDGREDGDIYSMYILRGGAFDSTAQESRCAYRRYENDRKKSKLNVGFRLVIAPDLS